MKSIEQKNFVLFSDVFESKKKHSKVDVSLKKVVVWSDKVKFMENHTYYSGSGKKFQQK